VRSSISRETKEITSDHRSCRIRGENGLGGFQNHAATEPLCDFFIGLAGIFERQDLTDLVRPVRSCCKAAGKFLENAGRRYEVPFQRIKAH
jgi:hypothetical protein